VTKGGGRGDHIRAGFIQSASAIAHQPFGFGEALDVRGFTCNPG
jgi:hypothetical protein